VTLTEKQKKDLYIESGGSQINALINKRALQKINAHT